jgi:hypothetical protein
MPPDPFKLRVQVDATITRLRTLGKTVNPLDLLSRVAFHHLMKPDGKDADHTQSEAQVEYLMSLFLAEPFPANPTIANPAQIQECIDALDDAFGKATLYYSLTSESKSGDKNESEVILSQRLQTLHVRGDSYRKHTELTFREIAAFHDPLMERVYGFNSADLLDAVEYSLRYLQASIEAELARTKATMDPVMEKWRAFQATNPTEDEMAAFEKENAADYAKFQIAADSFGAPAMFVVPPRHSKDAAIFKHLAVPFGDNVRFLTALKKWAGWPLNETVIHARPIILHEGSYYVFHLPLFSRNPLRLVESLISKHSETYWQNTFLKRRDDYVEATAIDLVERILTGCTAYKNLYYHYTEGGEHRRAELDGLILYDDCLLIIEVKASGLSDAAKRGAPERIREDLTASLDKAYTQALRVLTLMRSANEVPFSDEANNEICRVRFADYKRHFLISVTREQFASLATQLHSIRKLGLIAGAEWPWAVSLNDLRVITEIIIHPTIFLHYLVRRLEVNSYEAITVTDELDLFGHFLAQGLYFKEDEMVRTNDKVVLDGFTEDLDAYYRTEEQSTSIKKPRYPLPAHLEELIGILERLRPRHFSTAALQILAYGTEGHEKLNEQIPGCEDALTRKKVRIAGIANNQHTDAALVLFGAAQLDSRLEAQMIERAKLRKKEAGVDLCSAIFWEPPLAAGRIHVHIL